MRTQVCAVIGCNSTTTQKDSWDTDSVFSSFTIKKCNLCYFRDKTNNNASGICHSRRGNPKCSTLKYPICVVLESDSATTQRRYSILEDVLLGALHWEIWIVLLLTLNPEQHKFNLPLQRYFKGHAIRIQVNVVIEADSTTTQKQFSTEYGLISGRFHW